MSLLKTEPAGRVGSLAELFAIATALEEEAASRYREMAVEMRLQGAESTAAAFEHLAAVEDGHKDKVGRWSARRNGKAPDIADLRWHVPQTFGDEEAADLVGSRLVTPYRALSMAVRNEERAFAFWSYIVARTDDAAVREIAEALAREELEHVSMLRRERRRAYRSERAVDEANRAGGSPADGLAETAILERRLAERLAKLRSKLEGGVRARIGGLVEQSYRLAGGPSVAGEGQPGEAVLEQAPGLAEILARAEHLVERYLEAADRATDEIALNRSQSLAREAIMRLASLRALRERGADIGADADVGARRT